MPASTTLPQQLTELRRELATRQRVYPDWVRTHKLTQPTADHRTATLTDTIRTLETLAELLSTLAPGDPLAGSGLQGHLFPDEPRAPYHPTPGPYADH